MEKKFYEFEDDLREAVILSRPNRFIMNIEIDGKNEMAHCPVTGKIGFFDFKKPTPCLVSINSNPKRKTKYTVEAISEQEVKSKRKRWIGINQTRSNEYVEFFLRNNLLPKILKLKNNADLKREVKKYNSKFDFNFNGGLFLEVKTFLNYLPFGNLKSEKKFSPAVTSTERLEKHFSELEKFVKNNGGRSIVLITNQYAAKPFKPPVNARKSKIGMIAERATNNGVENWQLNLKINKKGVYFLDYYRLNLFNE